MDGSWQLAFATASSLRLQTTFKHLWMGIPWAFATAGESHPQLFKKLADEAIKRQHEFKPQEISNFLWAFATNGQVTTDNHLFSSLVPSVKANLDEYTAQDLANIAWAYSVANVDAPSVFNDEFINACLEKKDEFVLEALLQLHQWQLWQDEIKSDISLPSNHLRRDVTKHSSHKILVHQSCKMMSYQSYHQWVCNHKKKNC